MTSAIPVHTYHPPRHPHAVTPTPPPPASFHTSSSSTSTQHSTYWPVAPSSVSTTSSTASPRLNPGLAAAQYVTKHTTGRLHRRSRSGQKTPEEVPDEMFDEGFFSGPGSPPPNEFDFKINAPVKSKGKIKPLLKKVSGSSRNNSLDLSRSDGGLPNGVGLGIYDSQYDSSGVDDEALETAFPKHPRKRHARNTSGLSSSSVTNTPLLISSSNPNQPFAHPKRQVPRRGVYTPDLSSRATSDSGENSEDERETRRIVLSGSRSPSAAHGLLLLNTACQDDQATTMSRNNTSLTDLHSYTRSRTPSVQLASPTSQNSPVDTTPPSLPAKIRGRPLACKDSKAREPSPSFQASVTAARLAWEAKEEKKEMKLEQKRRRSEAKEEERRINSRTSNTVRGSSGSITGTVWNADDERDRETSTEITRDEDEVFTGRQSTTSRHSEKPTETRNSRGRNATGRKWGVLSANQNRQHGRRKHLGLKKRWLGFIVWVRIGMVRLGRKMGF
jgi:hypothetical protein